MFDDMWDDDGDPVQLGLNTDTTGFGVSYQDGPVLGIVLSVRFSDDENNLWLQIQKGDNDSSTQNAAYLEADVLVIQSSTDESYILSGCMITSEKTSNTGVSSEDIRDFTEDIPNGCDAKELAALNEQINSGFGIDIDNLSGDWVIVDFIGGVTELPFISRWVNNPKNRQDVARLADGRRYRFRRNGSGFEVDKNGNLSWTHRDGHYFQFRGKAITLKHSGGQVINLGEDGEVTIADKEGNYASLSEDGIVFSTGNSTVEIQAAGGKINVLAAQGDVAIAGTTVNLVGSTVLASDGTGGGDSLAKEKTFQAMKVVVDLIEALATSNLSDVAALLIELQKLKLEMTTNPENFVTSTLRGE